MEDRGFESFSLHRRVSCEPDFRGCAGMGRFHRFLPLLGWCNVAGAVAVLLGAAPPPSGSRTRPPIPRTTHRTTSRTTWRDAAPPGYEPPATRDQQLGGRPAPPGNPGTHIPSARAIW